MKICYFKDWRVGVIKGDDVVDVTDVVKDIPHLRAEDLMIQLISRWDAYSAKVEKAATAAAGVPVKSVRLRPPIPKPGNIVCLGANYMENGERTEKPLLNAFHKAPTSIIGDGDTMVLPDVPATIFEGEAELAVVIGKRATNVMQSDARQYIFGYTCFIDGSARGLPPHNNIFFQSKSRDTFAPIGPCIVTADEIDDPNNLDVLVTNNGELKHKFNTSDMAHQIPRVIEWVSSIHTLEPGDIVSTGTNHLGMHAFVDGDRVELTIEKVGTLHITVKDELKRKWEHTTRLEYRQKTGIGGHDAHAPQLSGKYAERAANVPADKAR